MKVSVDPIRVISKVRNNRLMDIRERMGMSTKQFAQWLGVSCGLYNNIENLTIFPSDGMILRLTEKLGSIAEEAFPDYLREIKSRVSERTIPEEDLLQLQSVERVLLIPAADEVNHEADVAGLIADAIGTLTPRQEKVIRMRFGMEPYSESHTFKEVGEATGLTKERIRQIETRALRMLRNPSRSRPLRVYGVRAHSRTEEEVNFKNTPAPISQTDPECLPPTVDPDPEALMEAADAIAERMKIENSIHAQPHADMSQWHRENADRIKELEALVRLRSGD